MEEKFKQRIGYAGDIKDISLDICKNYNIGMFVSNKLVLVGYEDFNYILETSGGKFLVKVFASFRDLAGCQRYVEIIDKMLESGVSTPKLLANSSGSCLHAIKVNGVNLRLCVMDFIEGKTFFESGDKLNEKERRFLAKEVAKINSVDIKPVFVDDEWAIVHFAREFKKKSRVLSKEDIKLVSPLVEEFSKLDIDKLPYCFVHGDVLVTNVIKDKNGKLWIIDFSVSNYYPRVQELAVLACNLFFDEISRERSENNIKILLEEYQKNVKLASEELFLFPFFVKLAHAMHILSASYEKVVKHNNSRENEY